MFFEIVLLLCAGHGLNIAEAAKSSPYVIEFTNVSCTFYENYIERFDCFFHKVETNYFLLNFDLLLKKDLASKTMFSSKFTITVGKKTMEFLKINSKMCEAMNQAFSNVILKYITNEIRRTSNVPCECPMKKNVLYKMENYTLRNFTKFPPYAPPSLTFVHSVDLYEGSRTIFEYRLMGGLIRS